MNKTYDQPITPWPEGVGGWYSEVILLFIFNLTAIYVVSMVIKIADPSLETLVTENLAFLATMLLAYFLKVSLPHSDTMTSQGVEFTFKVTILTMAVRFALGYLVEHFIPGYTQPINQTQLELTLGQSETFYFAIETGILAPIREEYFFRYLIMKKALGKRPRVGIFVSALLFSLAHGPGNIIDFIIYFVPGLMLAYLYAKTKDLSYPIVSHCCQNMFALCMLL